MYSASSNGDSLELIIGRVQQLLDAKSQHCLELEQRCGQLESSSQSELASMRQQQDTIAQLKEDLEQALHQKDARFAEIMFYTQQRSYLAYYSNLCR